MDSNKKFNKEISDKLNIKDLVFDLISKNSGDIISVFNTENECIYISKSVESILGYDPEEYLESYANQINHPDDSEILETTFNKLLKEGFASKVIRYKHKHGDYKYFETKCSYLQDKRLIICVSRDVTDNIELEYENQNNTLLLETILSSNDDGHFIIDLVDDSVFFSENCYKIFDMEPIISKHDPRILSTLCHPDDLEYVIENFNQFLSNDQGKKYNIEQRIITPKNKLKWVEVKCDKKINPQKGNLSIIAVISDISKRKQNENELEKNEAALKEAQEIADIGSWTYDYFEDQIYWSDHLYDIFEIDKSNGISNEKVYEMMHPDDVEEAMKYLNNYEKLGDSFDIEYRIITPNNKIKHLRSIGRLIQDKSKNIKRAAGTIQNITKKKEIENKLKLSEKKYRNIFENIQSVYVELALDGYIIEVSPSVSDILLWEREELIGRHISDFLAKENRIDEMIKILLEKGKFRNEIGYLRDKSGNFECFSINAKYFKDNDNEESKLIFTGINITKLIENEQKLQKYQDELIESNQAKDKLFSIISHDLRSPLSGFVELSKILLDEYETIPISEIKQIVTALTNSSASIYELLENLLGWSRIQQGVLNIEITNFDLNYYIEEIINLYKLNANKKGIEIIYNPKGAEIKSDKTIISTVLRNFLSNALKFTKDNGIIEINKKIEENKLYLSVSDNGVGLAETNIDDILNLNSTDGTRNEKGSGLGLRFSNELVKMLNGRIEIESQPKKGSKFIMVIPLDNY